MPLVVLVGKSVDVARTAVDVPPWAIEPAILDHRSVICGPTVTIIVFPGACLRIVDLTAGSAVERLDQV